MGGGDGGGQLSTATAAGSDPSKRRRSSPRAPGSTHCTSKGGALREPRCEAGAHDRCRVPPGDGNLCRAFHRVLSRLVAGRWLNTLCGGARIVSSSIVPAHVRSHGRTDDQLRTAVGCERLRLGCCDCGFALAVSSEGPHGNAEQLMTNTAVVVVALLGVINLIPGSQDRGVEPRDAGPTGCREVIRAHSDECQVFRTPNVSGDVIVFTEPPLSRGRCGERMLVCGRPTTCLCTDAGTEFEVY